MRTRGYGPWQQDWYSICSRHHKYDPNCRLCQKGQWVNRPIIKNGLVEGAFERMFYV